ncbi:MAG: YicC family protein [Bacteroidetes bacterium]|nr:YicC family protein [Bacteroidota bacterium]
MTGYGKSVCELPQKKVTIEIRSLNSRQLDLNLRMPSVYREKESDIRSEISKNAERGKIDFSIFIESTMEEPAATINQSLAASYHKELKKLSKHLGEKSDNLLSIVMRLPDVLKNERQELDEKEWKLVNKSIAEALQSFSKFRADEGKTLSKEFTSRIHLILEKLEGIIALDPQRAANVRERLEKNLAEAVARENVDKNRFEQELIYYLEKLDITEEKLRLKTHCDYFLKTMKEDSNGRKLGFISQEIGREINTIGSKANDAGIQKLVVEMKDELEKIKEQLLNVL